MEVKICGVRDLQAATIAVEAGAAAVGLVFAESPRRIDPIAAARIVSQLPSDVAAVAVFRHPSRAELLDVLEAVPVDFVQSEPDPATRLVQEAGVRLLPVVHDGPGVGDARPSDEPGPLLLEGAGAGGRGVRPDWTRAARLASRRPLVLAGGLRPGNVAAAIRLVRPAAVDVSSGVESRPGVKSARLIRAFIREVQAAGAEPAAPTAIGTPVFRVTRYSQ